MSGQNNIVYTDWQQIIPSSEISMNFTMNYRSFSYEWSIQQQTISNYTTQSIADMNVGELLNLSKYSRANELTSSGLDEINKIGDRNS